MCMGTLLAAQEFVLPGDTNNNGLVDHYDILPTGYAFGSLGPIRPTGSLTEPQEIFEHWSEEFPNGLNFIYADSDGNGMVNILDFVVIAQNQGLSTEPTALSFPEGIWGVDPGFRLNEGNSIDPTDGITNLELPITLESFSEEDEINGIAFTLEYNPDFVEQITFDFSMEWINEGGNAFQFKREEPGMIRVATTRFGHDPVIGGGNIGTVNMIIIKDLVGLLEIEPDTNWTFLNIRDIQAFDGDYRPVPIAKDSLSFVFEVSATASQTQDLQDNLGTQVFPNPTTGALHIQSDYSFESIELIQLQGRSEQLYAGLPQKEFWINLEDRAAGQYFLRIIGSYGISLMPLIINAN